MTTDIDICNRALQMAAARDTITALNDGSNEANNCNLLFTSVRDQVLGMAWWNFARTTVNLDLLKAAPGVPGSVYQGANQWFNRFPPPPWIYEYRVPSNAVNMRYVTSGGSFFSTTPIFSTPQNTYTPYYSGMPQKFVMASDQVGPVSFISGISKANPGVVSIDGTVGAANGDSVLITGVIGMAQINNTLYTAANVGPTSFELSGFDTSGFSSYISGGIVVNQTQTPVQRNVICSNAMSAIGVYTAQVTDFSFWSEQAIQAFTSALAGFLAVPLSGNLTLAKQLIAVANNHIIQARQSDGNEGLTTQNAEADWIAARFSYDDGYFAGAGDGSLFTPYPALFSVS